MTPLVEADWLAAHLGEPDLRIIDATIQMGPFGVRTGQSDWERGHIPGSVYIDLIKLSDPSKPIHTLTMPPAAWFRAAMEEHGIGDDSRVVIYDARETMWAARLWWMLRSFGFTNAAVLNGGWAAWQRGNHPVCTDPCKNPPATFTPKVDARAVADKTEVLAAIEDPDIRLVNALGRRQHRGEVNEYGRPGHIPGSTNVTAWEILDKETQTYKSLPELRKLFAGVLDAKRIITYCGAGIACSSDAFALHLLGHPDVAIYDGGLTEWCADPSLPLTIG